MAGIEEHLKELETALEKGQHIDSFPVRPIVRHLRYHLKRQQIMLDMETARRAEVKRLQKAIRRKNKLIKRLRSKEINTREVLHPTVEEYKEAVSRMHKNRTSLVRAVCDVLSEREGTVVACYGGTPTMPLAEYRRMPKQIIKD